MGKLSNTRKERKCLVCGETLFTTSKGLKHHANLCAIEKRTGLMLNSGIVLPKKRVTLA